VIRVIHWPRARLVTKIRFEPVENMKTTNRTKQEQTIPAPRGCRIGTVTASSVLAGWFSWRFQVHEL
jgi:hypothetical protein